MLLKVRWDKKIREKNGTDLSLRMIQDNESRENNDADLFLQVRWDLNSIDEWHRHVAKGKMGLDE